MVDEMVSSAGMECDRPFQKTGTNAGMFSGRIHEGYREETGRQARMDVFEQRWLRSWELREF